MLISRHQNNGYIFNKGNDEPLLQNACIQWLHKACERAGMRKIGWHTLRHTFASHLAQNSVSILMIKELLGHSDIKTTMRYSHLTPSVIRDAIETLNLNNGHNVVTVSEIRECKPINFIPDELNLLQKTQ